MRYVPGQGNPHARLMVIGEAPGSHEEAAGIPFVGPSGNIVNDCLLDAGTDRSEVYVTNVVKVRPPDNKLHRLGELHTKIEDFLPELWKEIEEINPNCILALGNVALKALTGETGIKNFRGSILPNVHTGIPKVVASMHPASLFHSAGEGGGMVSQRDLAFIKFDFKRAVKQSMFRELERPSRLLHSAHNSRDIISFFDRNIGRGFKRYTMDIETSKTIPMCVGFAFNKHEAISVPLLDIQSDNNPKGIPLHDLAMMWKVVAEFMADPQFQLIGQNLKFDCGRLAEVGMPTVTPWFDTQLAWHTLYAELPKKLAFISSVLTEEPYYKDELEEYNPKQEKLMKRLMYNAKDCVVEFECYEKIYAELETRGWLDFFFDRMMPLHRFYADMEKRGIAIDLNERKRLITKYDRYTRLIHNQNKKDLGYELNVMSNGEKGQVVAAIYDVLKCPARRDRDGKLKTDEETLEMLMLNAVKDDRRRRIIRNVLKERKSRKTETTYVKAKLFPDQRIRTVVNITGTESGRTSTSKPSAPVVPEPMGVALQTLTKHGDVGADIRKMYVPDKGKVFIEADLSQAEARVVALLANDDVAMNMMNRTDFKKNRFGVKDDIHTWTTILVTGAAFEEIDDEQRQLGKKTRHAGNYGMTKRRLSLLAQISEWKANQCLERFHDHNPQIRYVFWAEVQQALQDGNNILYSPHARPRIFFDKWGEDLFREAYSFIPQATVSDHLKFAAMRIEARAPWIEMLAESHDSFLSQVPIGREDQAYGIIREEMEVPIDFSRCSIQRGQLVIPCEIQLGVKNWKDMKKVA